MILTSIKKFEIDTIKGSDLNKMNENILNMIEAHRELLAKIKRINEMI